MPLNKKMEELVYDSRLLERYLKEGKLSKRALKKYEKELQDLSHEYDEIDVEELLEEVRLGGERKLPVGKSVESSLAAED